jgi:N6-adenosine-specific RNA methylase IME4
VKIGKYETHPAADLFPMLGESDMAALAADIEANGLRLPIVLHKGLVLDGRNRLLACERVGQEIRTQEYHDDDCTAYVLSVNVERRHLTPSQKATIAVEALPLFEAEAKARKTGRPKKGAEKSPGKSARTSDHRARNDAAKATGASARNVQDAKALKKHDKEKGTTLFAEVKGGDKTLSEAKREMKREKNREQAAATPAPAASHVAGQTYQTIVIDPPWDWGDEGDADQMGRARPEYATMPIADVQALDVGALANPKGCHLYLWITNRSLPKGFALLEAWGFRYVTILTWCKPSIGMGNYYRNNTEHVLFGVRGKLQVLEQDTGTWFQAARGKRHSEKPAEFFDMVQRMSPGPRLEMFARGTRDGWATWGAEAGS